MLTLRDINRALDRLGVEAFIPHTRRLHALRVAARARRLAVREDRDPSDTRPYRPCDIEES